MGFRCAFLPIWFKQVECTWGLCFLIRIMEKHGIFQWLAISEFKIKISQVLTSLLETKLYWDVILIP